MNRNPYEVLDKLSKLLPEKDKKHLERMIDFFTAPELIFQKLSAFAALYIPGYPFEQWHFEFLSILSTRPIEEIKAAFPPRKKDKPKNNKIDGEISLEYVGLVINEQVRADLKAARTIDGEVTNEIEEAKKKLEKMKGDK